MEPSRQPDSPRNVSILGNTFRYLISRPVASAVVWLLLGALPSWLTVYLFRANEIPATSLGVPLFVLSWALVVFFPLFPIALVAQSSGNDQYTGLGGLFVTFFRYLGRYLLIELLLLWRLVLIGVVAVLAVWGSIVIVGLLLHNAGIGHSAGHRIIATSVGLLIAYYLVLRRRVWAYYLGVLLDLKPRSAMKSSIQVARTYRRLTEITVLVGMVLPFAINAMSFAIEWSTSTLFILVRAIAFPLVQIVVGVTFSLHLLSHSDGTVGTPRMIDDHPSPE